MLLFFFLAEAMPDHEPDMLRLKVQGPPPGHGPMCRHMFAQQGPPLIDQMRIVKNQGPPLTTFNVQLLRTRRMGAG